MEESSVTLYSDFKAFQHGDTTKEETFGSLSINTSDNVDVPMVANHTFKIDGILCSCLCHKKWHMSANKSIKHCKATCFLQKMYELPWHSAYIDLPATHLYTDCNFKTNRKKSEICLVGVW